MTRYGSELIFITKIAKDGKSLYLLSKEDIEIYNRRIFELRSLSVSEQTYTASGMSTFIVKLKNPPPK